MVESSDSTQADGAADAAVAAAVTDVANATADADAAPEYEFVGTPRSPVTGPITTYDELAEVADRLARSHGPVAVDAERASGYRYSQRAYLIQLWRADVGVVLIDPIAVPDQTRIQAAIGEAEWVLHAASQDLPCLREVGLDPARIFDTETAGRLMGRERVSLGTMLEAFLGVTLEKGHSAADWSTRPLPADWLTYAALDVDLLVELRDAVAEELDRTGKREWAEQEFAATLAAPPTPPRHEPWRRTSGIHALRSRRQLAAVRSLWLARDETASARDIAPGRILPDSAIIAAVRANPATLSDLGELPVFRGPRQRKQAPRWFGALQQARELSEQQLPSTTARSDGIPATGRWREKDPVAAERLGRAREAVVELAEQNSVQAQNLLAADVIRRLCWEPPTPVNAATVGSTLDSLGARPWQIEICAEPLAAAMIGPPPGAEPAT